MSEATSTIRPVAAPLVPLAYRIPDAARIIGLSKSKMWDLIAKDRIKAIKIGGATVVRHSELEAFLAQYEAQASIK